MSGSVTVESSNARFPAAGLMRTICVCGLAFAAIAFTLVREDVDIAAHG